MWLAPAAGGPGVGVGDPVSEGLSPMGDLSLMSGKSAGWLPTTVSSPEVTWPLQVVLMGGASCKMTQAQVLCWRSPLASLP